MEHGRAFEPSSINRSPDSKLLVVGDTAGTVKLLNYPCLVKEVRRRVVGLFCYVSERFVNDLNGF